MKMVIGKKTTNRAITVTDPPALVHAEQPQPLAIVAPIVSSYNERIRPVLDAVENLRRLNITKEGIQLPTIVVVEIVKKINEKLANNLAELEKLPTNLVSVADAMTTFMHIIGLTNESLRKILLRGEFDEYPEDKKMHCTARLVEMLDTYSHDLYSCAESDACKNFLMEEIKVLEEAKSIGLPNFMPRPAFLSILQGKVKGIAAKPIGFVENVWNYLEDVLMSVITRHAENYYQLLISTRRAGQVLIAKKKQSSIRNVIEAIEMEMHTDYTCSPEFLQEYNKLIYQQEAFLNKVLKNEQKPSHVNLEGVGRIDVGNLRQYSSVLTQAYDLKVRMISYWKIVLKRLIDTIALHLMHSINNLVNKDLEKEIVHDLLSPTGGGIERLLEESPSISGKREKLQKSVKLLRESKETVANIVDRIVSYGDY
ncbi:Dynamin-related protein 4C [Spatholobus suberectus]|nr:Dynamin-related protein 4C [Spatholobus suberectus]